MIMSAVAIIAILVLFTYAYSFLHFMLTLSKCPDCGRIMQRVLYTDVADEAKKRVVTECQFCQAKSIRKRTAAQVHKRTLYP